MSWTKKYLFTIIISLMILGLLEVIARLFFTIVPAHVARGYNQNVISQIYGRSNIDDYTQVFEETSIGWEYHPFVEYKESPREGSFVSVSSDNIRCNVNGLSDCNIEYGKGVIWIFGGSTVFGYGVKNDETIASYIEALMPEYRVVNMGHSNYYSTSELILFNLYLSKGIKPEITIFFDGLNDYHFFEIPEISAASESIEKLFNSSTSSLLFRSVKDILKYSYFVTWMYQYLKMNSEANYGNQVENQSDNVLKEVGKRIIYNFRTRVLLGNENGVKVVNVLQPVPLYGIGHATSRVPEHLLNLGAHVNSGRGYEILDRERLGDPKKDFLDLSNLFIDDAMFVDSVHYTPDFNMEIAFQISDFIKNKD